MQTTIKNLITKAVTEIEEERADRDTALTGNEFLEALFQKLFPETPEVKKPAPKKKAAPKAAPKAPEAAPPATPTKDSDSESVVESITETVEKMTVSETPAKTVVVEAPPAPKKAPKPKKEKGPENLAKLTPTQTKKFKQFAEELKVEGDHRKAFLAYVNGMTEEEYGMKKLDEHMKSFLGKMVAPAPPATENVETDKECVEVVFNGKTYYVSPEDNKVYEEGEDGVYTMVGYAGMAAFKGMLVA